MKNTTQKEIDDLLLRAKAIGLNEVERQARVVLRKHPKYVEFVMGMGMWFFLDKTGYSYWTGTIAIAKLGDFISENEFLRLTGESMRFTATGPVRTEW